MPPPFSAWTPIGPRLRLCFLLTSAPGQLLLLEGVANSWFRGLGPLPAAGYLSDGAFAPAESAQPHVLRVDSPALQGRSSVLGQTAGLGGPKPNSDPHALPPKVEKTQDPRL